MARKTVKRRPRVILGTLASSIGCALCSIGDIESLAGVDIYSHAERKALWDGFRHLYGEPPQVLIDAVMDHCSAIVLKRLGDGVLSLVPGRGIRSDLNPVSNKLEVVYHG